MLWIYVKLYFLVLGYFVLLDLLWLVLVESRFIDKEKTKISKTEAEHAPPTLVYFYLLFSLGLFAFAVLPAVITDTFWRAPVLGSIFGFFIYAFYHLVGKKNSKFTTQGNIIDMFWGGISSSAVASATYMFYIEYLIIQ